MEEDLKQINKNFKQFDNLVSQQIKLSKSVSQKDFENKKKSLLNSFENLKQKCEAEVEPPKTAATIPKPAPLRSELVQKQSQAYQKANQKFPCNFKRQPEASYAYEQSQQLQKWNDCYWSHFSTEEKKEIQEHNQKNSEYQQQFRTPTPNSSFFYGSCIGLDGTQAQFTTLVQESFRVLAKELDFYMEQVKKTTWENLQAFQEKLKKNRASHLRSG